MGIQCRCNGVVRIKNGPIRVRPNGKTYQRKTVQCGQRKTLAKHPDDYIRLPKCPACGAQNWMIDKWRLKHEVRGNGDVCRCGGYHFQHRKGSKYCYEHPDAEKIHSERYKETV